MLQYLRNILHPQALQSVPLRHSRIVSPAHHIQELLNQTIPVHLNARSGAIKKRWSAVCTPGIWLRHRIDAFTYVKRLQTAGIAAENLHYPDMIHAFLNLEDLVKDVCEDVYRSVGQFLVNA